MNREVLTCFCRLLLIVFVLSPILCASAPARAQKIAGSEYRTFVVRADGTLWACGENYAGRLGEGSTVEKRDCLVPITHNEAGQTLPRFVAVSGGQRWALALDENGALWVWGDNYNYQLGDGSGNQFLNRTRPVRLEKDVNDTDLPPFKAISAGYTHGLALATDNTIWAWGKNTDGGVGDGTRVNKIRPVKLSKDVDNQDLPRFKAVAAGGGFSFALDEDGGLWTWGDNYEGTLGVGSYDDDLVRTRPGRVEKNFSNQLLRPFKAVAAGTYHGLALDVDGKLWGWGSSFAGQTGVGGEGADVSYPGLMHADTDRYNNPLPPFSDIAANAQRSVAIDNDGKIWAWGQYPDVGFESIAQYPWRVVEDDSYDHPLPLRFTAVAAGFGHTLALAEDGTVWAWGSNTYGARGTGTAYKPGLAHVLGPGCAGYFDQWLKIIPQRTVYDAPGAVTFEAIHTASATNQEWVFGDGSPTASGKTVTHNFGARGVYTVTLAVDVPDTAGTTSRQSTTATVEVLSTLTANAGSEQTVDEGSPVTLDGSDSVDPEGQPLSYSWAQTSGPSVTLSDAHAVDPSFTAPFVDAATTTIITFQLTISTLDRSATDTVSVFVADAPIRADAGSDQRVKKAQPVHLQATATDPKGQMLDYQWTQTSGTLVTLHLSNTAHATFTAPDISAGMEVLVFTLKVKSSPEPERSATDIVSVVVEDDTTGGGGGGSGGGDSGGGGSGSGSSGGGGGGGGCTMSGADGFGLELLLMLASALAIRRRWRA